MSNSPLLSVRNLTKIYIKNSCPVRVVDDVCFEIFPCKTLGLVGESGAGKSTIAKLILRLEEPNEGAIFFQGIDILSLSEKEMKTIRQELQIVFQDPYTSLNPRMTAEEIIMEPMDIYLREKSSYKKNRAKELMELVGLDPMFGERLPHQFSGGQRQRLSIARAIALNPRLIICDEPIAALDVSIQSQIINLLKQLQTELGLTYLFISHDLCLVKYLSDQLAVLHSGKIVEYGDSESIYQSPSHPYTRSLLEAIPTGSRS